MSFSFKNVKSDNTQRVYFLMDAFPRENAMRIETKFVVWMELVQKLPCTRGLLLSSRVMFLQKILFNHKIVGLYFNHN